MNIVHDPFQSQGLSDPGRNGAAGRPRTAQAGVGRPVLTIPGRRPSTLQSAPIGPAVSSRALRAFLAASIGQVPRVLDAEPAAATRRHHALLERGEGAGGAVIAVAAAVLDAPGPVDFRGGRLDIDCERGGRQHGEPDAGDDHGRPRNPPRRFEHRVRIVVPAPIRRHCDPPITSTAVAHCDKQGHLCGRTQMSRLRLRRGLAATLSLMLLHGVAVAEDALKIAVGQRGGWEQCVSELGQNAGIFKKHGLTLDVLYTQGSGETIQIVLSGSVDIGIGPGTHAVFGAFAKGAPIRMIGASFTGARDQLYYVRADSAIRGMKDAEGKSIGISTSGSSSHMLALALAKHFGVSLVPQATGNYASTLTQVMTKQVDIGFAQAPFALDAVEDGRIRLVAKGADIPEVQNQTIRAWIAHTNTFERRRDALARYVKAYRETLDWLYASPDAIKAYAAWSGLGDRLARQAPDFITKDSIDPVRIVGLEDMMGDAVKFKYIPAPLTGEQLATLVQVPK